MGTAHRVRHDLAFSQGIGEDPGASGTIDVNKKWSQVVQLVSAAAETRTLQTPEYEGAVITLYMLTDGGDITLSTEGGELVNQTGNNTLTFGAVADSITLECVVGSHLGANTARWIITHNDGVALSTV
jgi:hypothetical protein